MPKAWFVGSTLTDVILHVDEMPGQNEDLSTYPQQLQIGGCTFNASDPFRHLEGNYALLSPVGTGEYGKFVESYLTNHHIPIVLPTTEEHGCCYCLVDKNGERHFRPKRGAESLFNIEKLRSFPIQKEDIIYVCGIEIVEETGDVLIQYFEENPTPTLFFAPGPYMHLYENNPKWDQMMALHPILHLNDSEAMYITQTNTYQEAAITLYKNTKELVIITLGKHGAYAYDGTQAIEIKGLPIEDVTDTIGCGDNHAGMCIYGLLHKWNIEKILEKANQYASAVVQCVGGQLDDAHFNKLLGKDFIK